MQIGYMVDMEILAVMLQLCLHWMQAFVFVLASVLGIISDSESTYGNI